MAGVLFSHNAANGPESKTTSFRRIRQVAAPGAKSDVYGYLVLVYGMRDLQYATSQSFIVCHRVFKVGARCSSRVRVAPHKPARVVKSPGHPKPYPADVHCTWRVSARRKHRLRLVVAELHVEYSDSCLFDFLEVRAGRRSGNVLARYCGTQAAVNLSTTGNAPGPLSHSLEYSLARLASRCRRQSLCFTDVSFSFKCCPSHSTVGERIATRIVALTLSMKNTTATNLVNFGEFGPVTPEMLWLICMGGEST